MRGTAVVLTAFAILMLGCERERRDLETPPAAYFRRAPVRVSALQPGTPQPADVAKGSPQGLAASKALTTAAVLDGFDRDAERLTEESARLFVSDEAREGMLAFLQKRPPSWLEPGA